MAPSSRGASSTHRLLALEPVFMSATLVGRRFITSDARLYRGAEQIMGEGRRAMRAGGQSADRRGLLPLARSPASAQPNQSRDE